MTCGPVGDGWGTTRDSPICQRQAAVSGPEAVPQPREPARLVLILGLVLGLVLGRALATPDRRAEDIAEAGAGLGGAEFGHRLLLLVDLARLYGQRDPPGGAVDGGDLGVEPLPAPPAGREAVGALLAAVARQLGFADEAGHAIGQGHLEAGVLDPADGRGDDIAFLHLADARLERIGRSEEHTSELQ